MARLPLTFIYDRQEVSGNGGSKQTDIISSHAITESRCKPVLYKRTWTVNPREKSKDQRTRNRVSNAQTINLLNLTQPKGYSVLVLSLTCPTLRYQIKHMHPPSSPIVLPYQRRPSANLLVTYSIRTSVNRTIYTRHVRTIRGPGCSCSRSHVSFEEHAKH